MLIILGGGCGAYMTRQSSYNPQMAHMCSDNFSKCLAGPNASASAGVEMPLDLTTAAATVSPSESLRRLASDCSHQRQVTVGGGGASVGDISLLMQQFEALRVRSCTMFKFTITVVHKFSYDMTHLPCGRDLS